jgi:Fe-S-cluster containining protein
MSTKLGHILGSIVNSKKCLACKGCCIFYDVSEERLAPVFTSEEIRTLGPARRKRTKKRADGFYQAKVVRCAFSVYKKCVFLDEGSHRCSIYDNRPLDCELWPFDIAYDKQPGRKEGRKEGSISLWVASTEMCPGINAKDITSALVDRIIYRLDETGVFEEIKNGRRYVWGYAPYHKFLRKLSIVSEVK